MSHRLALRPHKVAPLPKIPASKKRTLATSEQIILFHWQNGRHEWERRRRSTQLHCINHYNCVWAELGYIDDQNQVNAFLEKQIKCNEINEQYQRFKENKEIIREHFGYLQTWPSAKKRNLLKSGLSKINLGANSGEKNLSLSFSGRSYAQNIIFINPLALFGH